MGSQFPAGRRGRVESIFVPEEPPLTEPVVINDTFITGADVSATKGMVRFTCWVHVGFGEGVERRIVARNIMEWDVLRAIYNEVTELLQRG